MSTVRELRFAQFTDIHLKSLAQEKGDLQVLETALFSAVHDWGVRGIFLTGDLIERGDFDGYELIAEAVKNLDVPVIPALGNHDDPTRFTQSFPLQEHFEATGPGGYIGRTTIESCDIIVLDSNIEDDGNGRLLEAQLEWLATQLATSEAEDTIVVVHHPPLSSPLRSLHRPVFQGVKQFDKILAKSTVRVVLSGHYHHAGALGLPSGVMAWAGPAFAWETDLRAVDTPLRFPRKFWSLIRISDHTASCVPIIAGGQHE